MNIRAKAQLITEAPMKVTPAAPAKTEASPEVNNSKLNVLVKYDSNRMPSKKPRSAKRVTINAFFEAAMASGFV